MGSMLEVRLDLFSPKGGLFIPDSVRTIQLFAVPMAFSLLRKNESSRTMGTVFVRYQGRNLTMGVSTMSDDHTKAIEPANVEIVEHRSDVSAMAMAMLERDMTPETAERVLDFVERMDRIASERAFTSALVEMKRALPSVIAHDRRVAFKNVRYCSPQPGEVRRDRRADPVGLRVRADTFEAATTEQNRVSVTATLTHRAGHSKAVTLTPHQTRAAGGTRSRRSRATTTYLRRYTAAMLLGIATSDMPDPDESEQASDPDAVDLQRNMRAATKLDAKGLLHRAEEEVGRPSKDWTAGDLDHLWDWARGQRDETDGRHFELESEG